MNRSAPWLPIQIGLVLTICSAASASQGFVGEARVNASELELRPLVRDSLLESQVAGEGLRRALDDGTVVTCILANYCRWFRSDQPEALAVVTQELLVTGWGLVTGLSAHAHLRGRYGSDDFWPLSSQEFEAVTAYVAYDQFKYRVRAGRLFRSDGLGYYNFDGASVLWRGVPGAWVSVYGGWSLARGLNVTRSGSLLAETTDLPTDDRGLIFGAEIGGRLGSKLSGTALYQREIRTDRLALYADRFAFDGRALLGKTIVDVASEYDLTYEEFNEVRMRVSSAITERVQLMVEARHYTPFFELWTIWGAFTPVGYNEGSASAGWDLPHLGLRLEAGGAYRDYEDTNVAPFLGPTRTDGWRLFGRANWSRQGWFANGSYQAEAGPGAARFGGDLAAGRRFAPGTYVAVRGSVTQTFGQFRLNEQLVTGLSFDGATRLGPVTLTVGAARYQLGMREREQDGDWSQARFHVGLSTRFGSQPGVRTTRQESQP